MMRINGVNPDLPLIMSSLIYMIFKESCVDAAQEVFEQLAESGPEPDIVTFNTMSCGYCSQRRLDVALQLFEEIIQGQRKPNAITCTILTDAFC
ncbi:hypothetical protein PS2_013622 [Malus domestica]